MWSIEILPEVQEWLLSLDRDTQRQIAAAIEVLEDKGPKLGRPLVDTMSGSSLKNLKELRPGSSGSTEIRILFVFDPRRQAVLLVGGDKAQDYVQWYRKAVPLAEARFALYLKGKKDE